MSATTSKGDDVSNNDVLNFVVHEANGVKGLVDSGLKTLPPPYIQPPHQRFIPNQAITSQDTIPIIDVSNWDNEDGAKVADSICEAATKWGFFQIINHGIPEEVLDGMKVAAHGLFGLPNEERKMFWKGSSVSDTLSLATSFAPLTEEVLEWKDYASFRFIPGDLQVSALWPAVCKEQVIDYMKRVEPVIKKLLQILLKKLNVEEIDKTKEDALMGAFLLNMNYYPKCPNPELTVAIAPHSDISSITVLLQDDVPGLYVRQLHGNAWILIPPVDGALVVNIGDVLQIMSNDLYKSVEHRVVANGNKNRVSIPIFVNPGPDALIGPLPEVIKGGDRPIYKQVVYSDYFNFFFSKRHDGKNSISFAKI